MDSSRKSELAIFAAILLSVAVFIGVHYRLSALQDSMQHSIDQSLKLANLHNDIRYYDEVLTMTAQVAAHSGDLQGVWRQRHAFTSKLINNALRRAETYVARDTLSKLRSANRELLAIEDLVFAALNSGARSKAISLLNSATYAERKQTYIATHNKLQNLLNASALANRSAGEQTRRQSQRLSLAAVILLASLWAIVLSFAARWRRHMVDSNTELTELAHYDNLTGVANRTLFNQRLAEAVANSDRTGISLALIIIDVDKFKDINDTHGHMAGDELLKTVATRLKARARSTDTVARLGGDEFAIVATQINNPMDVNTLANDVVHDALERFEFDNKQIGTGHSVGVALYPDDADDVESLMQKADFALYQAKSAGRSTYRLFDQRLEDQVQSRKRVQDDLLQGLQEDQFELHYQPLIDLETSGVRGVEALLRWNHPIRGQVPPNEFIPLAEEAGLMDELGDWVLRHACRQQVAWRDTGLADLRVGINLSSIQFQNPELVANIKQVVCDSGMSPGKLALEITETGIMDKGDTVIELLKELNDFGITLAIDDFGTGYSSLAYLKHFPVHVLKIDKSFVDDLPHNHADAAIARTIISMARSLRLRAVAEGVENDEQLAFLRAEGCDYVQGYYFAKPQGANDFAQWYLAQNGSNVLSFKNR